MGSTRLLVKIHNNCQHEKHTSEQELCNFHLELKARSLMLFFLLVPDPVLMISPAVSSSSRCSLFSFKTNSTIFNLKDINHWWKTTENKEKEGEHTNPPPLFHSLKSQNMHWDKLTGFSKTKKQCTCQNYVS